MERIAVGRYENPVDWAGYIHPDTDDEIPEWILFIDMDGKVALGIREDSELVFAGGYPER